MKTIKSYVLILIFGVAAFGVTTPSVFAVPIAVPPASGVTLITDGGVLLGARNVPVGTLGLFDVDFVDGTCITVFSGCDNAADDFAFQTSADAAVAAATVLALVLIDGPLGNFDSVPALTNGCLTDQCHSWIPYAFFPFSPNYTIWRGIINNPSIDQDVTISIPIGSPKDANTFLSSENFVVFSPVTASVPEPASLLLFGVGLLGLSGIRRRRQLRQRD